MPATAPEITTAASAPRVLLFGHPGSGKSSLLGALLQASDTQPDRLEAEVTDPDRRLELMRDAVYGGGPVEQDRAPLVKHVIEGRPLATEGEPGPTPDQGVLMGCGGAAAGAPLEHPGPLP